MISFRTQSIMKRLNRNEAALILSRANRFYLSGFDSSDGAVFLTEGNAYFLIDFRYYEKAKNTVNGCETILLTSFLNDLEKLCKKHDTERIFLETEYVSVSSFEAYSKFFENIEIFKNGIIDSTLKEMRSIKSESEQKNIREAQKITDETFLYILNNIEEGRTELEIMLDMEFYMRKLGSEGVSFDFIVISGKNSSLPHGVPTEKIIKRGDFVTMDFGAVIGGYRSDMTRTIAMGVVTDEQKAVYDTVLRAQRAAIAAIEPGKICRDIDKTARDIIDDAGYRGCFGHGLGHGVGIEIHENPSFSMRCDTLLKNGMVMTVEPGIYIENKFGVRIEDMIFVTEDGCIDITESPRDLIIL